MARGSNPLNTGQVISGIGHAGLIGWMLFGGSFQSEPLPFEVTEVSVISSDAFEALLPSGPTPDTATDVALPVEPEVEPDPVETPAPDQAVEADTPEPTPAPEPDVVPVPPAPEPEPEVVDDAPVQPAPQDQAVVAPDVAPRPIPRAAERVAPEPVAPPEPEATPDDIQQDAVTDSDTGETQAEEQGATAPEEATTEIVTEAEEPAGAPTTSLRPAGRGAPARPCRRPRQRPSRRHQARRRQSLRIRQMMSTMLCARRWAVQSKRCRKVRRCPPEKRTRCALRCRIAGMLDRCRPKPCKQPWLSRSTWPKTASRLFRRSAWRPVRAAVRPQPNRLSKPRVARLSAARAMDMTFPQKNMDSGRKSR